MRNGSKKSGPDLDHRSAGVSKGRRVHVRAPSRAEYSDASSGPQPPEKTRAPSPSPSPAPSPSPNGSRKSNADDVKRKR
jgi:hypothetical protein